MTTTLYIKNMVCNRCIEAVGQLLAQHGLHVIEVQLGRVTVEAFGHTEALAAALQTAGFALVTDREQQLTEQIKSQLIGYLAVAQHRRLSDFLAEQNDMPYTQLSKTFSKSAQITIEKYFILLKTEKAKELISYGELSLSEIADQLAYSSVQALSNQFKQVTGLTVSAYKEQAWALRKTLDKLV